jgi:hypothetical protein
MADPEADAMAVEYLRQNLRSGPKPVGWLQAGCYRWLTKPGPYTHLGNGNLRTHGPPRMDLPWPSVEKAASALGVVRDGDEWSLPRAQG